MTVAGNSYNFVDGHGGATYTNALSFGRLSDSHVTVTVDAVLKSSPGQYSISGDDVIFTGGNEPAVGTENVRFQRVTPKALDDRYVDYVAQANIQEDTLDLDQQQLFYMIQEADESDDAGSINPNAEYIRYDSSAGHWDAARDSTNTEIAGVLDPTQEQSAATKKYVDDIAAWGNSGVPQFWAIAFVDSVLSYTLTDSEASETNMTLVWITGAGGDSQLLRPGVDFNVTPRAGGATLVLTSALGMTGGDELWVLNIGRQRYVNVPIVGPNTVNTEALQNLAVTTEKINAGAVQNVNIDAAAVDTLELADSSVTEPKISTEAVNFSKMVQATPFTSGYGSWTYDKVLAVKQSDGKLELRYLSTTDLDDWDTRIAGISLSDLAVPDDHLSIGTKRVINVGTPSGSTDAATKGYVDTEILSAYTPNVVLLYDDEIEATARTTWDWGTTWLAAESVYSYYKVEVWCMENPSVSLRIATIGGTTATGVSGYVGGTNTQRSRIAFTLVDANWDATKYPAAFLESDGQRIISGNVGPLTNLGISGPTLTLAVGTRVRIFGYKPE